MQGQLVGLHEASSELFLNKNHKAKRQGQVRLDDAFVGPKQSVRRQYDIAIRKGCL